MSDNQEEVASLSEVLTDSEEEEPEDEEEEEEEVPMNLPAEDTDTNASPTDAPPTPVPGFALTPAQAARGIIDMTESTSIKLWSRATKALSAEGYDCDPSGLHSFLNRLSDRAYEFGWEQEMFGILNVPERLGDPNSEQLNLLTNYGRIRIGDILAYERTYIGTQSRRAQDNAMLYHCLVNSLSQAGKGKVDVWKKQYHVTLPAAMGTETFKSGLLLLKIIIRESHLDSNATISTIRKQLSNLDDYMPTIKCDITKFNAHVKSLIENLGVRGEQTHDLLVNLFKGYEAVSDRNFRAYIAQKQDEYDDGKPLKPDELMLLADNKFKNLVQKGKWNALSEDQEKIIALEAQVAKFKKDAKNSKKREAAYKQDSNKKNKKGKSKKPDWLLNNRAPDKDLLHKQRTWNNNTYFWCDMDTGGLCNGKWRTHFPKECKGANYLKEKYENSDKDKKAEKKDTRKLKVAKANEAVVADCASSDSDSE